MVLLVVVLLLVLLWVVWWRLAYSSSGCMHPGCTKQLARPAPLEPPVLHHLQPAPAAAAALHAAVAWLVHLPALHAVLQVDLPPTSSLLTTTLSCTMLPMGWMAASLAAATCFSFSSASAICALIALDFS